MSYKERKYTRAYNISRLNMSGIVKPPATLYTKNLSWTDSVSGESIPNWKDKLKRGTQATSRLSGRKTTLRASPGTAIYEYRVSSAPSGYRLRVSSGYLLNDIGIWTGSEYESIDIAEQRAREVFYSKYRSSQTAIAGGVALGELGETLRMLTSPAKALRKRVGDYYSRILSRHAKRYAGRTTKQRNRYLSETWLEASFGWLPFISDVKDAMDAMSNRQHYLRDRIIIQAFADDKTDAYDPNGVTYAGGKLAYVCGVKTSHGASVQYRGALRATQESPIQKDARLWGFTPDQIIPTVWELMPYSFVIDYFTNIGKVIDAWSIRRARLTWGARTVRQYRIRDVADARSTNDRTGVTEVITESFSPGTWRSEETTINRYPVNSVPIPDFRFRLPGSNLKWLNLGALARVKSSRF